MIFDSHVHSYMSGDSHTPPEEEIRRAEALGLGLVFTEHMDYDLVSTVSFEVDVEKYLPLYEKFRGPGVCLGLEIGLTHQSNEWNAALAKDPRLDFVLGSIHMVNGLDIYTDLYKRRTREEAATAYLETMLQMVRENPWFDSLAHIDYPARVNPYAPQDLLYEEYSTYYDLIFRQLVENGQIIELNTRRLGKPEAARSLYTLYKRYYELGGRYVTLGSDAHVSENIGHCFPQARVMLDEIGLTPVWFMGRKMRRNG